MKKLFTLFFVAILAFVFVACKEYTITIDANDLAIELTEGESKNVAVQFTEGETLSWVSSSEAVATVADGKITAVKEGEATITVTIVGHEEEATATINVKVLPVKVSDVRVRGDQVVFVGKTLQLTAEVTPENAKDKSVTWASSNEALATVDANGLVTAVKEGNVEITATSNDGTAIVGKLAIEVKKEAVTGIEVAGTDKMEKGTTQNLQVSIAPDAATYKDYTFASSDDTVLTVSAEGVVTAVKAGTATVTVTSVDNPEVKDTLEITVYVNVATITISNAATMNVGDAFDLACTVAPEDATNKEVEWSSSDSAILLVSNGKVTAVKAGTAKLVATAKDGSEVKAELEITVSNVPVSEITIAGKKQLVVGQSDTFSAAVAPSNATNKAYTWSSSNAEVATVDENGKVTAVAVGTVKIIATANDGSQVKGEVELEVVDLPLTTYVFLLANEQTSIEGLNLKYGYNLFATVEEAIDAVVAGGNVVLFPGLYTQEITISKSVTLQSLSGEKSLEKDVTKTAVVTSIVNVFEDNVTIKGLTFTGAARVVSYNATNKTLKNFVFENNYVYDTADATVAWQDTRYSNGITEASGLASLPGFICLAGSYAWVENTKVLNNKFENVSDCNVYIICTDGVTVEGNEFIDCDRDVVRLDYNNNQGKINVKNNKFTNVKYNGFYLRSYGAGGDIEVVVEGNYFKNVGTENVTSNRTQTAAFATAAHQETTNVTFKFTYNIFDKCDGNINIRGNVTNSATWALENITFTLDVEFNAFILNAATDMINKNFFGSDSATTNFAIGTFDNNFYGTDFVTKAEMADTNYENILAKDTTTYANIVLLDKAAKGKLANYEIADLTATKVSEIDALDNDKVILVEGQVTYVADGGFMLKDESGVVYVYDDADVLVGDKVKVTGLVGVYKQKQVAYASKVEVVEAGTYTYNFTALTEEEFKALEATRANVGKEITLTGLVVKSGSWTNFKVGASTVYLTCTDDVRDQLLAYMDSEKTVTVSFVTYYKDGSKTYQVLPVLDTIVPSEGLNPSSFIVDPTKPAYANRVQKLSDLEGKLFEGATVYVKDGTVEGDLTINTNNVSIIGNGDNSIITGKITIAKDVKNTVIEGVKLVSSAKIIGAAEGGQDGITIDKCIIEGSTADNTIYFGGAVKNVVFTNNKVLACLAARTVRAGKTLEGFVCSDNYFEDGGYSFDWLRTDGAISGEVVIENNVVKGSQQSFIMFMAHGNGNFTIQNNKIYDMKCVAIDIRTTAGVKCTSTFNVIHNVLDNTNIDPTTVWNPVRFRFNDYTEETLDANVNLNVYINWGTTFLEDASGAKLGWVNMDNNYFDGLTADQLTAENFDNIAASWANPFTSVEALEKSIPSVYDFAKYFDVYGAEWTSTYMEHIIKSSDLGNISPEFTFILSNADRQSGTITDRPVICAKNVNQYVTVQGDFSGVDKLTFSLMQWGTKTFADIHIEYTVDGENWVTCSDVITTPGDLSTNADISGAKEVRLSFVASANKNTQIGLSSVSITKK